MKHYLIVWGNAVHEIRAGDGDPRKAAHEAFGVKENYALKRMTWKEVSLLIMRSDIKRTKACVELLEAHRERIGLETASEASNEQAKRTLQREIDDIKRRWSTEWARYEVRYGVKVNCGSRPFFFDGQKFRVVQ